MKVSHRLVLSDVHIPGQDDALMDVWLDRLASFDWDGVDIIGDVIDCYALSRFDKNPRRKFTIQDEIDIARSFLERMREAAGPKCDIRYTEGNHEARLTRVLWSTAKPFAHLRNMNIPGLMGLKDLNIKYYSPERPYRIGDLWYMHGDLARKSNWSMTHGGTGAAACVKRVSGSVMMGHTHQMGLACFRNWHGLVEGYECGCMCNFDQEYIVGFPQWQQGWCEVTFEGPTYRVDFIRCTEKNNKRYVVAPDGILATLPAAKNHLWSAKQ